MAELNEISVRSFEYYESLRKLRLYVESNYHEKITLRTAARIAGLEEKYFSTFFHRKVGMCFTDWLTAVRVAKAVRLLDDGDYPIARIAFDVGFASVRTFERAFKRHTGCTAKEYKSSVRPEAAEEERPRAVGAAD